MAKYEVGKSSLAVTYKIQTGVTSNNLLLQAILVEKRGNYALYGWAVRGCSGFKYYMF